MIRDRVDEADLDTAIGLETARRDRLGGAGGRAVL